MTKPEILVIGHYDARDRANLEAAFTCHDMPEGGLTSENAPDVEAVALKFHAAITGEIMDMIPNLKVIANYGVGYDSIDEAAATARGIKITNTPDVLTDDVADLTVAMLIGLARNVVAADAYVRSGDWGKKGAYPLLHKVSGARAGIVGLGRIGRAIADRLAAFHMPISYTSRAPKDTPGWAFYPNATELARNVDYLVCVVPGGPETEGIISAEVLDALGPDGSFINVARGSTVDEEALIKALQTKSIRGAALDVFLNEPNPDARFLALDNVLLQPHQCSATVETRGAMADLQLENLKAHFDGKPLITPVN